MTDSATSTTPPAPTAVTSHSGDGGLERVVFFSDAVFAIALTLLALELPVPHGANNHELWRSFRSSLSQDYLMFVISFLVIAQFWLSHHNFFQKVVRVDRRLIQLNLLYLLGIVLIPFATKVLGEDGRYAFGTILYAITVALVGALFAAFAWYAGQAGMVGAGSAAPGPRDMTVRAAVIGAVQVVVVFGLSIGIALASPDAAKYFWLVLAVLPAVPRLVARVRR